MAWSIVGLLNPASYEVTSGNLTLAEPSGVQQGDLLVACIAYRSNAAFTAPANWNVVATQQSSGDTDATSGIASGGMWWIVRGVSPPSFAWTRTGGDVAQGTVIAYRGNTASPYDTGNAGTLATIGEPSLSGISTANPGELLVAMISHGDNSTTVTMDATTAPSVASTTTDTTTNPTDDTWIERVDRGANTGADTGLFVADGVKVNSGATGIFSADASTTTRSVMIVGAFKVLFSSSDNQPGYFKSKDTSIDNQPSYFKSSSTSVDNQPGYFNISGAPTPISDNQPCYFNSRAAIEVNESTSLQTIIGWSAVAQAGHEDRADYNLYKDSLLDQAVNDLNITSMRCQVRSGMLNTNDWWQDYHDGLIDFATYQSHWYEIISTGGSMNYGELDYRITQVINPWRQKLMEAGKVPNVNLCIVDFNTFQGSSDTQFQSNSTAYSNFVVAVFQHIRDTYGWVPDALDVILEADTAVWTGTQTGNNLVAAHDALATAGFNPRILAPSTSTLGAVFTNLFDEMIGVTGVSSRIDEISYHIYGTISDSDRQAVRTRADTYGLTTSQTEKGGGDYIALHKDLSIVEVGRWQQFALAFPTTDDGYQYYYINGSVGSPVINMGSRTKLLRQYFKYARRNAVVKETTSYDSNLESIAFLNTNTQRAVVVKAVASGRVTIDGLPDGDYGIKYTTASDYDIDLSNQTLTGTNVIDFVMPAAGAATVYSLLDDSFTHISGYFLAQNTISDHQAGFFTSVIVDPAVFQIWLEVPQGVEGVVVSGSQPGYFKGQNTDSDNQTGYFNANNTILDNQIAFFKAENSIIENLTGYFNSQDTSVNNLPGYFSSENSAINNLVAYFKSQNTELDNQPGFFQGKNDALDNQVGYFLSSATIIDNQSGYFTTKLVIEDVELRISSAAVSDNQSGYFKSKADSTDTQPGFFKGQASISDTQSGYFRSQDTSLDSQSSFFRAEDTALDNQIGYFRTYETSVDNLIGYFISSNTALSNKSGYFKSQNSILDNQVGYFFSVILVTDSQSGFFESTAQVSLNNLPGYFKSKADTSNSQSGYFRVESTSIDNQSGYFISEQSILNNQIGYFNSKDTSIDSQPGYFLAKDSLVDSQSGYFTSVILVTDSQSGYFLTTALVASNNLPGYFSSKATILDNQPSYFRSENSLSDTQAGFFDVSNQITSNLSGYFSVYDIILSSQKGYFSSKDSLSDNQVGYFTTVAGTVNNLHGYFQSISSGVVIPIFMYQYRQRRN